MAFRPPQTGIELVTGIPGAGKSYLLVRRIIEAILRTRRPVYTNLPLRFRVIRRYLHNRGGRELAGLIRPLTEAHFRRFIDRFAAMQEFKTTRKATMKIRRVGQAWIDHAGPDVTEGDEANWIPAGAFVVIDEVQHWFPNPALPSMRGRKDEPPSLMSYLTMHRHLLHCVWFATQAERQVSQTIKTLTMKVWEVVPLGERPLAWGIKFKHVGLVGLGYTAYRPDDEQRAQPCENFVMLVNLPWNQKWFRLYDSFTHAGSRAELVAGWRQAQVEAGLHGGMSKLEVREMAKKKTVAWRAMSWGLKWAGRAGVAAALLLVGYGVSSVVGGNSSSSAADAPPAVEVAAPRRDLVLGSIGRDGLRIDGKVYGIGGICEGLQLEAWTQKDRFSLWRDVERDELWLWRLGRTPQCLGARCRIAEQLGSGSLDVVAGSSSLPSLE